jgi:uncharacterized repeat protein (TIGR01451 family)
MKNKFRIAALTIFVVLVAGMMCHNQAYAANVAINPYQSEINNTLLSYSGQPRPFVDKPLSTITLNDFSAGNTFTFYINFVNTEGTYHTTYPADYNSMSVSFPSFTSASDKVNVSFSPYLFCPDDCTDDFTYNEYFGNEASGGDGNAEYLMVEAVDNNGWLWNENNAFKLTIKPKDSDVNTNKYFDILFRAAASDSACWPDACPDSWGYEPDGATGYVDPLGFNAYKVRVYFNKSPDKASNPNPTNNATGVSLTPSLSWSGSDPDNDTLTYDLYFGTNSTLGASDEKGSQSSPYTPGTLSEGTTYYWRVDTNDGNKTTTGDVWSFTTTTLPAPSVTSFSINGGAASTASRTVTLNNTATNNPTQYIASEASNFSGASWQTYSTSPSFTLSQGNGTKRVYFKVRRGSIESTSASDAIVLTVPPTVNNLNPNPNPTVSEIMAGGTLYRYYLVKDPNGNALSGAYGLVQCDTYQITTNNSDTNGLLEVDLRADELGTPGASKSCSITKINGQTITPVNFQVSILPRESDRMFKFGTGINVSAGLGVGGTMGDHRGLIYDKLNADPTAGTDGEVEIERLREVEGGVEGKVGAAPLPAVSAKAEASLTALLSAKDTHLFDNPYDDSGQKIRRLALFNAGLLTSAVRDPLLDFLTEYTMTLSGYDAYLTDTEVSTGIAVEAGASAKVGDDFGLDGLDVGIGAGVSAGMEFDASSGESYTYSQGSLSITEKRAGVSFSGHADISAGAGIAGDTIEYSINGGVAGNYDITFFRDNSGSPSKAQIALAGEKTWGVGLNDTLAINSGETSNITLTVTGQNLQTLENDIDDIMKLASFSGGSPSGQIVLGPENVATGIQNLVADLNTMTFDYTVRTEQGRGVELKPGFEVDKGVGPIAWLGAKYAINTEEAVSFETERGVVVGSFGKRYPLEKYQEDGHIPSTSTSLGLSVLKETGKELFSAAENAGQIIVGTAAQIGSKTLSGIKWLDNKIHGIISAPAAVTTQGVAVKSVSSLSASTPSFGIGGIFMFTPTDSTIAEISSQLTTAETVTVDNGSLVIQPNSATGQLTISYTDGDVTGIDENSLGLYYWDSVNEQWIEVPGATVDAANNSVSADVDKFGIYSIGLPLPQGEIGLTVTPRSVDVAAPGTITVTSGPIRMTNGSLVPDGTLVTVQSLKRRSSVAEVFGTITTPDVDAGTAGTQVATLNGTVTFQITPPALQGEGVIFVSSVGGAAVGKAYFTVAANLDTDGDGLPDWWEYKYFGDLTHGPAEDPDGDGLTNLQEYQIYTDPTKADTDGDGMPDGWEVQHGLNPLMKDSLMDKDNDGRTSLNEYENGTDPTDPTSYARQSAIVTTLSDAKDPVFVGQEIVYNVTVTNNGPDGALGVSLSETLPSGASYISANPSQGSCQDNSGTIVCDIGDMAKDAAVTIEIDLGSPQTAGLLVTNLTSSCTSTCTSDPASETTTVIAPPTFSAMPLTLATGITGQSYSQIINFNASGGSGDYQYQCSASVPGLTAVGDQSGSCTVSGTPTTEGTYTITLGVCDMADQTVCATEQSASLAIEPPPMYTLTVNDVGTGAGTVTSDTGGISCGTNCSASYQEGTTVILTATPDAGMPFGGWYGCTPVQENPLQCTTTMNSAQTVNAVFFAASSGSYKLPDTGQTKCYQAVSPYAEIPCPPPGDPLAQDGSYPKNPLSYTDLGGNMILDNNTGLIWQKCSAGQNSNATCSGTAATYNWYKASGTYDATYNPSSMNVCGALGPGWRLPTKKELIGIVDYSIPYPGPTIKPIFTGTVSSVYWSSTTYASSPVFAWVVGFSGGGVDGDVKYGGYYVRCVRSGQ